ncbi:MAG: class I SAM-dependent methyltransferase family protein [Candidatus Nanohaloarchaea archaeon]
MNQEELEEEVKRLFEEQGFKVSKKEGKLEAERDGNTLFLRTFSYQEYSEDEVLDMIERGEKVFVDEGLEEVKDNIENQVSVLRDEDEEEYKLPSYELIGEIAVINELTVEEEEAVEGILEHHPSVKTILLKEEPLQGEYRVGEYRKLYGEETETVHKEFGCRFKVDPTVAFFSEREGTERKRILEKVEEGERILVMFCGIGPYPVFLARKKDVDIVGVEKNPKAVEYARQNVKINNVEDSVEIIQGDVAEEVPELGKFDRILMPSPTNAEDFLNEAFVASESGTKINFYGISEKEELFDDYIREIKSLAERNGLDIEIVSGREISDYSPYQRKVAIDFLVK